MVVNSVNVVVVWLVVPLAGEHVHFMATALQGGGQLGDMDAHTPTEMPCT